MRLAAKVPPLCAAALAIASVSGCTAHGEPDSRLVPYGAEASAPEAPVPHATPLKHGPGELIGRYVSMWNYALVSGATEELAPMITPDCVVCWQDTAAMARVPRDKPYTGPLLKVVDVAHHSLGRSEAEHRFQAHLQLGDRPPVLVDLEVVVWKRSSQIHSHDGVGVTHNWRMKRMTRVPDGYYATAPAATVAPKWTPTASPDISSTPLPQHTTGPFAPTTADPIRTELPAGGKPDTAGKPGTDVMTDPTTNPIHATAAPSQIPTPVAKSWTEATAAAAHHSGQPFPGEWLTIPTAVDTN